jgi:hypothetical protein
MGVESVYCVYVVYNFYAGCTKVAPDCARSATGIKKEWRPAALSMRGFSRKEELSVHNTPANICFSYSRKSGEENKPFLAIN